MFSICSRLSNFIKICPNLLTKPVYNVTFNLCNSRLSSQLSPLTDYNPIDLKTETEITRNVLKNVNENQETSPSRLFAVVQICGKQFKVTTDDVIVVEGYWPPDVGDKLSLNKILCAGGLNFSLIGTPLIQPGLVNICAKVIEKTLSHTKTHFRKKRRKQYKRIHFYRCERTVLRITDIGVGKLDDISNN